MPTKELLTWIKEQNLHTDVTNLLYNNNLGFSFIEFQGKVTKICGKWNICGQILLSGQEINLPVNLTNQEARYWINNSREMHLAIVSFDNNLSYSLVEVTSEDDEMIIELFLDHFNIDTQEKLKQLMDEGWTLHSQYILDLIAKGYKD